MRTLNSNSINKEEKQLYNHFVSQIEGQELYILVKEEEDGNIFIKLDEQRVNIQVKKIVT